MTVFLPQVLSREHRMIEPNRKEIWRYLGYGGREPDSRVKERIEYCVASLNDAVNPGFISEEYELRFTGENELSFAGLQVTGRNLYRNLQGCRYVVLFAATLGIGPDRLIARASVGSPSDMVIYQAAAAAMIEAYCDMHNDRIRCEAAERGFLCRPRFSPGYGDFALDYQRNLLQILQASKRIGVTLTDSLLMMPSKSVTALIGLADRAAEQMPDRISGQGADQEKTCEKSRCESCGKSDCVFRSI